MNKIFVLISFLIFLSACQSTQDAFTLQKKSSADEFLVEKKSPLVLPPEYGKLPMPQENQQNMENNEIKDLLSNKKNESSNSDENLDPISIEKSILEKIQ